MYLAGGGIDYSTSEQDTGILWIDGRHIYQKTVNVSLLANQNTNTSATLNTNANLIINGYFMGKFTSANVDYSVPVYYNANTEFINWYYKYSDDTLTVRKTNATIGAIDVYITLQYVKVIT